MATPYDDALAPAASFDLADRGEDAAAPSWASAETLSTRTGRRYLAPEIGDPPGFTKKPAMLRIRGRKVKLRVPL